MEALILQFQEYILQSGSMAPIVYILLMIVAIVVSPIPSSPLAIAAGMVFGWKMAFIYTMTGSTMGAVIAFYIARILGKPIVVKIMSDKQLSKVSSMFSENSLTWSIFVLRLLPLPFFDAVSYVAGLSSISLVKFTLATFLGLIPLVLIFSYFGDLSINIGYLSLFIILISLVLPFLLKTFYDKKKMKK